MKVRVRYFAALREAAGRGEQEIEVPASVGTIGELRDHLVDHGVRALAEVRNLRAALNQSMAAPDTPIGDGDEVAFFPPVTGG